MNTVSICIPYYFGSGKIANLLNSIVMQKHVNAYVEILIVDDSPNDKNLHVVLSSYCSLNIKVVSNGKNLGPFKSAKIAYANASSDYIIHFDQDDYFVGELSLASILSKLSDTNIKSVSPMILGPRTGYVEASKNLNPTFLSVANGRYSVPHSGHGFRRKDLNLVKLPSFFIDLDIYRLLVGCNGKLDIVNSSYVYVSKNDSSITSSITGILVKINYRILVNNIFLLSYYPSNYKEVIFRFYIFTKSSIQNMWRLISR